MLKIAAGLSGVAWILYFTLFFVPENAARFIGTGAENGSFAAGTALPAGEVGPEENAEFPAMELASPSEDNRLPILKSCHDDAEYLSASHPVFSAPAAPSAACLASPQTCFATPFSLGRAPPVF